MRGGSRNFDWSTTLTVAMLLLNKETVREKIVFAAQVEESARASQSVAHGKASTRQQAAHAPVASLSAHCHRAGILDAERANGARRVTAGYIHRTPSIKRRPPKIKWEGKEGRDGRARERSYVVIVSTQTRQRTSEKSDVAGASGDVTKRTARAGSKRRSKKR